MQAALKYLIDFSSDNSGPLFLQNDEHAGIGKGCQLSRSPSVNGSNGAFENLAGHNCDGIETKAIK